MDPGDFPSPGGGSVSTVPARTSSRRRGFFCREHGGGRRAGEKPSGQGVGGHRDPDGGGALWPACAGGGCSGSSRTISPVSSPWARAASRRNREPELHKTSLLVTLPSDYPGALHQVLSAFAWRQLNLCRIESRPTKKGLGSYHFFIDVEKDWDPVLMAGAVAEIEVLGCHVRRLGSFPCYRVSQGAKPIVR